MHPGDIPNPLHPIALRSFRESLSKAKEQSLKAQEEVKRIEIELTRAMGRLNSAEADCKAYRDLIEALSGEREEDEGEGDDSTETDLHGNMIRLRRKARFHVADKAFELIKARNKPMTIGQFIEQLTDKYGVGEIAPKTIKNAIWQLSAERKLTKHYSKQHREYIYGDPSWFNEDGTPKSEPNQPLTVNEEGEQKELPLEDIGQ